VLSFSVAASCSAVYLLCYSFWGRSCVGVFFVVALECGCEGGFYGWWGFRRASKIMLGNVVCLSFKLLLIKYSA